MPHLILEHTDNVEFDSRVLFGRLHETLVATGAVRTKGLKSRAVKLTDYFIADGNPEYKLVHLTLVLREGRAKELKEDMAQRLMVILDDTFGHYRNNGHISISTDMRELMYGIALTNNSIPLNPTT